MRFIGPELILATTDLTKFVRCDHSTFMDHGTKNGTITPLAYRPPSAMTELITRKGDEHEHAHVDGLRAAGKRIVTIEKAPWSLDALRRAEAETLEAMRSGADYVCQAAFFDGRWSGYADLLARVDRPSPLLGSYSYEVIDTKLARSVRAHFLLQLSDYSHHLARLQGSAPESMHVVLGTNERVSFRVRDFDAYYRHVRASLDRFLLRGDAPSPYPVEFCALCNWWAHCSRHWSDVDHLSLVANIKRTQVTRLERDGVRTLTELAEAAPTRRIAKIPEATFGTLNHQARLQLQHKRSGEHTYEFGDKPIDPSNENAAGEIVSIDDATRTIRIKRGPSLLDKAHPKALMPGGPINTSAIRNALQRFASSVVEHGFAATPYRAAADMFLSSAPRLIGAEELHDVLDVTRRLDQSYLFVQGPPGSGKTYTGARVIVELLRAGKRIGVTSNSHKAIHNLLEEVERVARADNFWFRGLKKSGSDADGVFASRLTNPMIEPCGKNADCADPSIRLIAGTAWLFSDADLDQSLDYLFIDEAGQVSLANALAVSTAARNVVLLGDPLQLAQVSQGSHPDGAGVSVLEHLLGKDATVPPDRGIFLEESWRMHPDVCAFVSEVVYESRLRSADKCARQAVTIDGVNETGVRFLAVEHDGNSQSSDEEAVRIASEVRRMLRGTFTNAEGVTTQLRPSDFLVVAAYNAQVRHITSALADAGLHDVPVGTVDKFQGRQAPIVFFSMATSSGAELPRDIDFLFSRNRLNVAISRARCLAIVVASPRLLDVHCKTSEQMRLVNGLCRYVEMATIR